eukprot:scaffold15742_cov71-Phaeocystis_antarctica.AAC.7
MHTGAGLRRSFVKRGSHSDAVSDSRGSFVAQLLPLPSRVAMIDDRSSGRPWVGSKPYPTNEGTPVRLSPAELILALFRSTTSRRSQYLSGLSCRSNKSLASPRWKPKPSRALATMDVPVW